MMLDYAHFHWGCSFTSAVRNLLFSCLTTTDKRRSIGHP
jgi:hypothetical protein